MIERMGVRTFIFRVKKDVGQINVRFAGTNSSVPSYIRENHRHYHHHHHEVSLLLSRTKTHEDITRGKILMDKKTQKNKKTKKKQDTISG